MGGEGIASAARMAFALLGSFFLECRLVSSHASCQTKRYALGVGAGSSGMPASCPWRFPPRQGWRFPPGISYSHRPIFAALPRGKEGIRSVRLSDKGSSGARTAIALVGSPARAWLARGSDGGGIWSPIDFGSTSIAFMCGPRVWLRARCVPGNVFETPASREKCASWSPTRTDAAPARSRGTSRTRT